MNPAFSTASFVPTTLRMNPAIRAANHAVLTALVCDIVQVFSDYNATVVDSVQILERDFLENLSVIFNGRSIYFTPDCIQDKMLFVNCDMLPVLDRIKNSPSALEYANSVHNTFRQLLPSNFTYDRKNLIVSRKTIQLEQ